MPKPLTDTCECGRPEVGPKHCPVHGDGKPQTPAESSRELPEHKRKRVVKTR
jgi:hypothetical protein